MMEEGELIKVEEVSKSFIKKNETTHVLKDLSLEIKQGEIVSILGESGCGKSTLLNIIGGFEKPDCGKVFVGAERLEKPNRKCVMLFQHYGLLPWRTVYKNVALGLEQSGLSEVERKEKVRHYLQLVGLEGKGELFPHELSGGMQQRVGIARALALSPEVILLDEPFAALDTFNRYYLQDELLRIQEEEKTTMVLVTHDIDEAIYLSDRIFIMQANPGVIDKEIKIELWKPRDRSHNDFQHYRKLVFEQFHFQRPDAQLEFNI